MKEFTPHPIRHLTLCAAISMLAACNSDGNVQLLGNTNEESDTANSSALRSNFSSYAALAHLQAEARSANGSQATATIFDMYQAATGADGSEDSYGKISSDEQCNLSGIQRTQYNIGSATLQSGDRVSISELGCSTTHYQFGSATQRMVNSTEKWEITSGTVNDYDQVAMKIVHSADREQSNTYSTEKETETYALNFEIQRDSNSRYLAIRDSKISSSHSGTAIIDNYEERVAGDICERSYEMHIEYSDTDSARSGLQGYTVKTLQPTVEQHIEDEAEDNSLFLVRGKVQLLLSSGAVVEYSATEHKKVLITLDTNADGEIEESETLDYDDFIDRAYSDDTVAGTHILI